MSKTRIAGSITKNSAEETVLHVTDGSFNSGAAGGNEWYGISKGITEHNYVPEEPEPEELDGKAIVWFRRGSEEYKGQYGFDWMRDEEDEEYNYWPVCGLYEGQNPNTQGTFKQNFKEYQKLEREYAGSAGRPAVIIPYRQGTVSRGEITRKGGTGAEPDKYQRYYASWLSLYPEGAGVGKNTVKLNLLLESEEAMTGPFELVCEHENVGIEPKTLEPLKKATKRGKPKTRRDAITITAKGGGWDSVQEVKVIVASETEKDADGNGVKQLAGKLLLFPNSSAHRYRVNILFVEVILEKADKDFFQDKLKNNQASIETWLSKESLNQALIQPWINPEILQIDLMAEYEKELKTLFIRNPSKGVSLGGNETVLGIDKYQQITQAAVRKLLAQYPDVYDKYGIVALFYNTVCFEGSTVNADGTFQYSTAYGITYTPGIGSSIFQNGINKRTLSHEFMHALGLNHTFDNPDALNAHTFEEYKTDNIMDYAKAGGLESTFNATSKWQWEQLQKRKVLIPEKDWKQPEPLTKATPAAEEPGVPSSPPAGSHDPSSFNVLDL